MFGTNLQSPRMVPMTRPMSGAPNNIQPGMRPMATPMAPPQQIQPMPQPGMQPMPQPGMQPMPQPGMQRPMMMAHALRGRMA